MVLPNLLRGAFLLGLMVAGSPGQSSAPEVTVSTREALVAELSKAGAGTVIRIAPGNYEGGISARGLRGTKDKPILITALDPKQPPVFTGRSFGFQLSGCSHIELRDLQITGASGNGLNIDDASRRDTPPRGIVLRRLTITNIGPKGNCDGIKMSGVDGLLVEDCRVERWGSSGSAIDFVGCHEGAVQGCRFTHDPGPGSDMANGVQMKGGSRAIAVRQCQFFSAGGRAVNAGGSTNPDYFRPADAPHEASQLLVEDCLFVGSMAPVAFVGVDGAHFQYNTIVHPTRWVLRILQENKNPALTACRKGIFSHNLVVFRSGDLSTVVNAGGGTEPATFRFEKNAWHCEDRPAATQSLIRLPAPEAGGNYGSGPAFQDAAAGDYRQAPNSPTCEYGVREKPPKVGSP